MRRIRYSVAASLDGFIAGPAGQFDWIIMDPEIDFQALFDQFDTILMGRRSFEVTGGGAYQGMKTFVVSRTLRPEDHPGVTILSGDLKRSVTKLREQPGKDIWLFGGGHLFRSLLDLGLVDAVDVAVIPVVLGEGLPLLAAPFTPIQLKLKSHRVYKQSGIVSLEYDLVPRSGPRKARATKRRTAPKRRKGGR